MAVSSPTTPSRSATAEATTVAGDDWHLMRGLPYFARTAMGLRRPSSSIPGQDLAGTVEAKTL